MTPTKQSRDKHSQLIGIREYLEQEIETRKRKMQISNTGNPRQWQELDDQIYELEYLQKDLTRFLTSYESTWELG